MSSVAFGVPAYNEGEGVVPTLQSLLSGSSHLGLKDPQFILSESCDSKALCSVPWARGWAESSGVSLLIEHGSTRRSLKEALNIILGRALSDILIISVADVIVPDESLAILLRHLLAQPRPVVAIGGVLPDPAAKRNLRSRAGSWQIRAVWRAASLSPRNQVRAEGAFWGAWREFYSGFRYPIRTGSIHDDVELARTLSKAGARVTNAVDAFVYKIPPSSFQDLCLATVRWGAAAPDHNRPGREYLAAIVEAVRDPVGASMYAVARLWCRANLKRFRGRSDSEMWEASASTKRKK